MEEKKINKWLVVVIIILLVIICVASVFIVYNKQNNLKTKNPTSNVEEKNDYYIIYDDMGEPGNVYQIKIDSYYNINVTRSGRCSTLECKDEQGHYSFTSQYKYDLLDEDKSVLKGLITKFFLEKEENTLIVNLEDKNLTDEEMNLIESVVNSSQVKDNNDYYIEYHRISQSEAFENSNSVYIIKVDNNYDVIITERGVYDLESKKSVTKEIKPALTDEDKGKLKDLTEKIFDDKGLMNTYELLSLYGKKLTKEDLRFVAKLIGSTGVDILEEWR